MGADRACADLVAGAAGAIAAERDQAEGAQLELIAAPATRRLSVEEARSEGEARRGRGRPKGATNLATRELRELLGRESANPVLRLAAWGSMEPEELADRLQISRAEAFDRLAKIWEGLAPYVLPKLAPTDETGRAVPALALIIGGSQANGEGAEPPWARAMRAAATDVEFQALSAGGGEPSKRAAVETEE